MKIKSLILMVILTGLCSCAPFLQSAFETPTVSLTSFNVLPGNELVPTFEIGLHVVNPNRTALKLQGLTYQVELEGHQILYGVANQLPVIEAYGQGDVVLQAQPDLFNTLKLFSSLLKQPRETFTYNFNATLDVGTFWPKIKVNKNGQISLVDGQR
jgi:LEA14-like dessication related protein